ncbi:3-dehydroquinate synthase [Parashewanella curva]|uniref:3-dehydroquinate synthase n=2 Tax=Parashewanella curva TaxID=2338552 RepID=A0A3L8PX50_9GAMM|nr:3-dehydroquinate synthase [Parashewanella curva]RLV59369.1 3-dehydroquinate synthase [Parashewanella curva]
MECINVQLENRSYPIIIGQQLFVNACSSHKLPIDPTEFLTNKKLLIVSNDTVAPLYLEQAKHWCLQFNVNAVEVVILPDGEQYKDLEHLNRIFDALIEKQFGRDCILVALGGGVIGDMTGFAAACYQRGVDFIQIPTTLLAQVDSSVGGKTGVNHALGKNMIGSFHQPKLVLIDSDCLATLPDREFAAGMAEVIKYGLLWDIEFFEWIEQYQVELKAKHPQIIIEAIKRCCEIKAEIVIQDETEQGCRALLNLGHTFGHAIETGLGHGTWLHGEAVAAGMVMAFQTSQHLGWISEEVVERVIELIAAFDLPTCKPEQLKSEQMLALMQRDKKVKEGQLRLILPQAIGNTIVTSQAPESVLTQVLSA